MRLSILLCSTIYNIGASPSLLKSLSKALVLLIPIYPLDQQPLPEKTLNSSVQILTSNRRVQLPVARLSQPAPLFSIPRHKSKERSSQPSTTNSSLPSNKKTEDNINNIKLLHPIINNHQTCNNVLRSNRRPQRWHGQPDRHPRHHRYCLPRFHGLGLLSNV